MIASLVICVLGGIAYWRCGFNVKYAELGELGRIAYALGLAAVLTVAIAGALMGK